jgi:CBS domain-containing protein
MKVRDIMTSEGLATADLDTTLEEIAKMMKEENVGAIPILDEDDNLAGIITDRDIVVRAVAEGQDTSETTAEEILSEQLHTIEPDFDIEQAADLMALHKIRRLPVVENGQIIGMISLGDISVKSEDEHAADVLEDISEGVTEVVAISVSSEDESEEEDRGNNRERRNQREGRNQRARNQRTEARASRSQGSRTEASSSRTNRSQSDTGELSAGEEIAAEETDYERQSARRSAQSGTNRSGIKQTETSRTAANRKQAQQTNGGNQQQSARGRQNTSARGRDSGQVRGEDARSHQGITNRTSSEEKSRQQKVAPIRAESGNQGKNRNKKRAS